MDREVALLPVFLGLTGRQVVVVGGGPVAASKLDALIAAGAQVTVVAPEVVPAIERRGVDLRRRPFEPADLDAAWLVVAAAPREVNDAVAAAAATRRVFVNAVDDPANASAYLGGVVRRAGVTVAISTDGVAPALAGLLREAFETLLPDELEAWVRLAREERRRWLAAGVPMAARRPLLLEALVALHAGRIPGPAHAPAGSGQP